MHERGERWGLTRRYQQFAIVLKRNKPPIKRIIDISGSIKVRFPRESFIRGLTIAPRFAMACAQMFWLIHPCHAATSLQLLHVFPKLTLPATRQDQLLFLGLTNISA